MERKRVGILVFPEVEVLDFCGPYEVFYATRLDGVLVPGHQPAPGLTATSRREVATVRSSAIEGEREVLGR